MRASAVRRDSDPRGPSLGLPDIRAHPEIAMDHPSAKQNATGRIARPASYVSAGRGMTARLGGMLVGSAALLGGMALLAHRRGKRAEREHPPQGRFLDLEGTRLHYIERGDGPPVVFLHGNGAMIQDLESSGVLDLTAERHRVVAFDMPGFCHSDRPRDRTWTPDAPSQLILVA